ncbi:unnamed protein product, partial [marine sediment metagenome]
IKNEYKLDKNYMKFYEGFIYNPRRAPKALIKSFQEV